jgi:hypothetical protein
MCDEEGCHRIECDGCRFQLDTLEKLNDFDTVEQIREVMARRWNTRADQGGEAVALSAWDAEYMAIKFHEAYERLAPSFGYATRNETRVFDEESANGKLMIAVCAEILEILPRATAVEDARDAARYRWLRVNEDDRNRAFQSNCFEELDKVIDAALSAQRRESD